MELASVFTAFPTHLPLVRLSAPAWAGPRLRGRPGLEAPVALWTERSRRAAGEIVSPPCGDARDRAMQKIPRNLHEIANYDSRGGAAEVCSAPPRAVVWRKTQLGAAPRPRASASLKTPGQPRVDCGARSARKSAERASKDTRYVLWAFGSVNATRFGGVRARPGRRVPPLPPHLLRFSRPASPAARAPSLPCLPPAPPVAFQSDAACRRSALRPPVVCWRCERRRYPSPAPRVVKGVVKTSRLRAVAPAPWPRSRPATRPSARRGCTGWTTMRDNGACFGAARLAFGRRRSRRGMRVGPAFATTPRFLGPRVLSLSSPPDAANIAALAFADADAATTGTLPPRQIRNHPRGSRALRGSVSSS